MSSNPVVLKDSNQQQFLVATTPDAGGNLSFLRTVASVDANGVASATAAAHPLPVINTAGSPATDGSSSITVGGSAQILFGGTTPVNGYLIANNSASNLYFSDVGTASTGGNSIPLAPGANWTTPPGYKPPGPVSIFGGVTSQVFAARRW